MKKINKKTEDSLIDGIKNGLLTLNTIDESWHTDAVCLAAVEKDWKSLRFVKNQTDEICLAAVTFDREAMRHVKNQTDELCLAAVNINGEALKFVENKTMDICLAAVKNNQKAFVYVDESIQTEEMCMTAVAGYGDNLRYVKNQTEEMCVAAVSKMPYSLRYVKKQTEAICLAALKGMGPNLSFFNSGGDAIGLIKINTPKIYVELCKKSPFLVKGHVFKNEDDLIEILSSKPGAIRYVANPSLRACETILNANVYLIGLVDKYINDELRIKAVNIDGMALRGIGTPCYEVAMAAVKNNGLALQFVKTQTNEICDIAVNQNPDSIRWVLNKTSKLIELSVKRNGFNIQYIPGDRHSYRVKKMAVKHNGEAIKFIAGPRDAELVLAAIRQNISSALYISAKDEITEEVSKIFYENLNKKSNKYKNYKNYNFIQKIPLMLSKLPDEMLANVYHCLFFKKLEELAEKSIYVKSDADVNNFIQKIRMYNEIANVEVVAGGISGDHKSKRLI